MPGPAGEVYAVKTQIGRETTAGTPVAATRIMYYRDPVLNNEQENEFHDFPTGDRAQTLETTAGVKVISGRVVQNVSADENLELFNIGINGTATISTPGGGTLTRDHTFIPGTLATATLELDDGAIARRAMGVRAQSLRFAGNTRSPNLITAELFGQDLAANALTGSLSSRQPTFYTGRETKLYIGAFGADPTSFSSVAGFLLNWDVNLVNNLDRQYGADNTAVASSIPMGVVGAEATFTFIAVNAQAATQIANHQAATKLAVRLEFGNNAVIEGALRRTLWVDLPGAWSTMDLGGVDTNTRVYEFRMRYVKDNTQNYPFRVVARCSRTAAFV